MVLSPTKDDKGDYLETERDDQDDSKRLKRVFFETFLGSNQPTSSPIKDKLAPEVLKTSIFDTRDDSPTQKIQTRGREKLMSVRADPYDGKILKRSILGSIDDFIKTTDQHNQVPTHSLSDESASRSVGRRVNKRSIGQGSNVSANGGGVVSSSGYNRRAGGNRLNFSVDYNNAGISQPSGSRAGMFSEGEGGA